MYITCVYSPLLNILSSAQRIGGTVGRQFPELKICEAIFNRLFSKDCNNSRMVCFVNISYTVLRSSV